MPPKKKGQRNVITEDKKRELIIKEDLEEYAKIDKPLGDGRFNVLLCTGETVISVLAKRFRRKRCKGSEKVTITPGDIVLVSFRSYENKSDIIHKYDKNEIEKLVKLYEIPANFSNTENTNKYEGFEVDNNPSETIVEPPQIMPQNRKFDLDDDEENICFDDI
jgi:initiation factor 1A